jgi:predicted phosphodiesterase
VSSRRWLALALAVVSLVLLGDLGLRVLQDKRIRLRTLMTLDPPPGPTVVEVGGHTLSVTGALVRERGADRLVLRAWAPTPGIHVVRPGAGALTVVVDNVPARVHLEAAGPVRETRAATRRTVAFEPRATPRLAFADLSREVTFAALGDTGDDPTFVQALRLAAHMDVDFVLHLGDLIYEDVQMAPIARILAESPVPVYVVRGNHDYRNQARIDFMRALGPAYYVFGFGSATFLVLDDAGNYLPTFWQRSTQYRWFTGVLGIPRDGPLFVIAHKPLFDRRTEHSAYLDDEPFARQLKQDFARAGVAAMFAGHVHETHYWVEDGIPYVVNGEGYESRTGARRNQMAWARVRGWDVVIHQIPIWGGSAR